MIVRSDLTTLADVTHTADEIEASINQGSYVGLSTVEIAWAAKYLTLSDLRRQEALGVLAVFVLCDARTTDT